MTRPGRLDPIVDGVLRDGFAVSDDVMPVKLTNELRELCLTRQSEGSLQRAGTGKRGHHDASIRSDTISWLDSNDPEPTVRELFALLDGLRLAVNQRLFLNVYDVECHVASYSPGAFYQRHLDQFAGNDQRRQLSFVVYLNQDWDCGDGGALRLYLDGTAESDHLDVSPVGGRLVVFESARYWHEVLPATRARLSVAGWFRTRS